MLDPRGVFVAGFLLCLWQCGRGFSADAKPPPPEPLVAAVWVEIGASGAREVVIEPDAEKLKSRGLTLEGLRNAVAGRRFVSGKWTVLIGEKQYDLADLAKLTQRELHAPPFTVTLRDGRDVLVTPNPKRVGHYVVTGEFFERSVRNALADFAGESPAKTNVLGGILVPGTVIPHVTEKDTMRHFSIGEPLRTFAKLEITSPRKASPPPR